MNDKNWLTEESQAEVRKMWAENPAMERETWGCATESWLPVSHKNWHQGIFYRPAQKPREKSQEELCREAYQLFAKTPESEDNYRTFVAGWNAREASRKGVA